ncbi:MAG: Panacea domain-containing protein [Candidatus Taylorbacteria bacterium]|nr:Panacea domain-containing protein [Candidatus Taylorbacteria bacterium]
MGKTKLMKLFYYLDFSHVKKYACPVTYDQYINLEHGPIPSTILNLVNEAVDDVDHSVLSDSITFEKFENTGMCRMKPLRPFSEADENFFTESELDVLKSVCMRFGDKNTKFIEDASHEEAPWKNTEFLEKISFSLATGDEDCIVEKEEIEMCSKL